ncbi:MAG: TlpA disulfide reductase family protein [bacterium]|nr:TlpA disulfide reductase family protein [bacterium]
MRVKPQIIYLWAVALIALLGYGTATMVLSYPPDNKENISKTIKSETLPSVTFYDGTGAKKTLEDFRGSRVLVNLWATWCTPCVAELPSLAKLTEVTVVAISLDRNGTPEKIATFLKKHGAASLPAYLDTDRQIPAAWEKFYQGLPTSFLLDKSGNIVDTFAGPFEWDKPEIRQRITNAKGQ